MKELLAAYVKRVRELSDHVKGNEQAAKQSLIGPLFTMLGYDLTDPRECIPEYKADFGKDRSTKPVDWAFLQNGNPIFFVEAKDAAKKLAGYDEQLGDYFAKVPEVKLGILTNGIQWRFFTDGENTNVMDREPFLDWNVLKDEDPPADLLTLLRKDNYNAELMKPYAQRKRQKNLLVGELNRLLEPAPEFMKLALANLETRNLTAAVMESWKKVLASAIDEWVRQRVLSFALSPRTASEDAAAVENREKARVETTQNELDGLELVQNLLGKDRQVEYEDTASYFKIHLPEQRSWAVCRFYFGKRRLAIWVPLPSDKVRAMLSGYEIGAPYAGWSSISLSSLSDLGEFGSVLRAAWDLQYALRAKGTETPDESVSE